MTVAETLMARAEELARVPRWVRDEIRARMPYYLWIDNHFDVDCGWPELVEPERLRLITCEMCGGQKTESIRRGMTGYRHGEQVRCPMCGGTVTARHLGYGIKGMTDRLDAVWYEQVDGMVLAKAAHCVRIFELADRRHPWTEEVRIGVRGMALFKWGEGGARVQERPIWEQDGRGLWQVSYAFWKPVKSMTHLTFGDECGFMGSAPERVTLGDSIEQAVRGTPFERAWDDDYVMANEYGDGVAAMDFIARRPVCEYLKKLDGADLVAHKVSGAMPTKWIRWTGKSAPEVLRVSPQRWGQIKGARISITPRLLGVIQLADDCGWRCSVETADRVAWLFRSEQLTALKQVLRETMELLPEGKRGKGLKFMAGLAGERGRNISGRDVADYWMMMRDTGASLLDDRDAFPKNFMTAHEIAQRRQEAVKNEMDDVRIRARAPELEKKYGFEFGGLILRPAMSAEEVIREGQTLGHCVARYVRAYALGNTVICVLRRAVQPDAPWRTVEIDNTGHVVQDRGYKNDWSHEGYAVQGRYRMMLDMFWEAWKERKIAKTETGRRSA